MDEMKEGNELHSQVKMQRTRVTAARKHSLERASGPLPRSRAGQSQRSRKSVGFDEDARGSWLSRGKTKMVPERGKAGRNARSEQDVDAGFANISGKRKDGEMCTRQMTAYEGTDRRDGRSTFRYEALPGTGGSARSSYRTHLGAPSRRRYRRSRRRRRPSSAATATTAAAAAAAVAVAAGARRHAIKSKGVSNFCIETARVRENEREGGRGDRMRNDK